MLNISYAAVVVTISVLWLAVRGIVFVKHRLFDPRREAQLILVYICLIVIARFTFFPFAKVNGNIQPLVFDGAKAFPFRINVIPFVNLFDYPERRDAILNFVGNSAMFIPVGVIWPAVYKELNTHWKVIAAGVGFSLIIEILQLPFFDRVTDIDDLLLNSLGYLAGYGLYLLTNYFVGYIRKRQNNCAGADS